MSSPLLTYSQAIETFTKYKRSGLVKKARHLLDNVDNVLTCINIDRGRDPKRFNHISNLLKLKLYREDIEAASTDADIARVVTVAKFLLENQHYLEDDLASEDQIYHPKCTLTSSHFDEASGLAVSVRHSGYLYTYDSQGEKTDILILSALSGDLEATITLSGVSESKHWTDIAAGPCDDSGGSSCIYIGEFADGEKGIEKKIYRVIEPAKIVNQNVEQDAKLVFTWDQTNLETLMEDPKANLYILSKDGMIGKIPHSAWSDGSADISTAMLNLPGGGNDVLTGGDITRDGREVLIKTEQAIFLWYIAEDEEYLDTLETTGGTEVTSIDELEGKVIRWVDDGRDYYSQQTGQRLFRFVRQVDLFTCDVYPPVPVG